MKLWHVYVALAVIGFLGTGSQVLGYVDAGPVGGTVDFWQDALTTNDAARFLAIDITVLGAAVFVFLGVESHRVGISAAWFVFYLVGALLIGLCTFAPLYFAHRQRRLDSMQVAQA